MRGHDSNAPDNPSDPNRTGWRRLGRRLGPRLPIAVAILLSFALLVLLLWQRIFIMVHAGEAGVLWNRFSGTRVDQVFAEGLHVISPLDVMTLYEVRKQIAYHQLDVLSSEGLTLTLDLAIRYRPEYELLGMLEAVSEVQTPDAYTAVIRLHHPHPALFTALAAPLTPILPAHVYGNGVQPLKDLRGAPAPVPVPPLAGHPANAAPRVGSGPFRFVSWAPDGDLVLARFDDFFLPGLPLLDRLVFRGYDNQDLIAPALRAGEIQLVNVYIDRQALNAGQANPLLRPVSGGFSGLSSFLFGLTFNLRRPPMNDPRVRRAIDLTLDRDHLYNRLSRSGEEIARGPFPPGHAFASPAPALPARDVDLANRLLDQAGWPRGEDGYRFSVEYINGLDVSDILAFGEYLRSELGRELGIEVQVTDLAGLPQWFRRMGRGEFDLGLDVRLSWGDPILGLHRTYHSRGICPDCPFSNYAGYANPEVDALLDAAARELDPARRAGLYRRFQDIVARDLPYLWLGASPVRGFQHRDLAFPVDSPWAAAQPYDRGGIPVPPNRAGDPRPERIGPQHQPIPTRRAGPDPPAAAARRGRHLVVPEPCAAGSHRATATRPAGRPGGAAGPVPGRPPRRDRHHRRQRARHPGDPAAARAGAAHRQGPGGAGQHRQEPVPRQHQS